MSRFLKLLINSFCSDPIMSDAELQSLLCREESFCFPVYFPIILLIFDALLTPT